MTATTLGPWQLKTYRKFEHVILVYFSNLIYKTMGKKVAKQNSLDGVQRVMLLPEHYPELNGHMAQAWIKDGKIVKIVTPGGDSRRISLTSLNSAYSQ